MPSTTTFALFLVVTMTMLLIPGPSVVYVVARSIERGRMAGLSSMLGLEAGMLVHVLASAAGVSALIASSEVAFTVLRWCGAGYLVLLGIRQFRQCNLAATDLAEHPSPPASHGRLFRDGFLVDVLNPKTSLFFVAFLPQFVDPARGPAPVQLLVLGLCVVPLAALTDGSYALLAGGLRRRFDGSARAKGRVNLVTGALYCGLAGFAVMV
ncbi:LysE family translocator [Nocardioides alcanivorans]|uniref:LysE family translocator n=1 Tax=Nocardioides alcanivorans TaxID=2897352 RepID=UPI001F412198|nr:LysE family translocator [Nocardioides alcanivorans]